MLLGHRRRRPVRAGRGCGSAAATSIRQRSRTGLPRWRTVRGARRRRAAGRRTRSPQVAAAAGELGPVVLDLPRAPSPVREAGLACCELCVVVAAATDVRTLVAARAVLRSLPDVPVGVVAAARRRSASARRSTCSARRCSACCRRVDRAVRARGRARRRGSPRVAAGGAATAVSRHDAPLVDRVRQRLVSDARPTLGDGGAGRGGRHRRRRGARRACAARSTSELHRRRPARAAARRCPASATCWSTRPTRCGSTAAAGWNGRRCGSPTTPRCAGWRSGSRRRPGGGSTTRSPSSTRRCADGTRLHAVLPPLCPHHDAVAARAGPRAARPRDARRARRAAGRGRRAAAPPSSHARLAFVVTGGTGAGQDDAARRAARAGRRRPSGSSSSRTPPSSSLDHPHAVRLVTRAANVEGAGAVGLRELVRQSLRMRPDRLVVGEFRGAEMVELLVALNTGHEGGAATLHANSARRRAGPAGRARWPGRPAGSPRSPRWPPARCGS